MSGKEIAALKALEWVKPGMTIGLGTGTTTYFFLKELGKRCQEGLKIQGVPSSEETHKIAKEFKIPLLDSNSITSLDLTVDGADEIDPQKRLIKGAGGALLREKILASISDTMIIIADSTKLVKKLGKRPLPVEIAPFCCEATRSELTKKGYRGVWLDNYITDNGNRMLHIQFDNLLSHPEKDDDIIRKIPGVVGTGFFFGLADHCIIGYADGKVEIWN